MSARLILLAFGLPALLLLTALQVEAQEADPKPKWSKFTLADKAIELGKHPGREFQIKTPSEGVSRSRIYIVGARPYQLTVAGLDADVASKAAGHYLGSLTLDK